MGRMDELMGEWIDEWMNDWMNYIFHKGKGYVSLFQHLALAHDVKQFRLQVH